FLLQPPRARAEPDLRCLDAISTGSETPRPHPAPGLPWRHARGGWWREARLSPRWLRGPPSPRTRPRTRRRRPPWTAPRPWCSPASRGTTRPRGRAVVRPHTGPRHRQLRGAARHRGGAPGPGRGREERDHKRSRITFALRDNDKCRREACDIRVLLKGVPQKDFVPKLVSHHADLDWTARYVGIIKWFRAETGLPASIRRKDPGYGYIACRETFKLFERDVWAYPAQLQGFKAGDAVSFRVSIDHWYSWPIALDIEPAPSPLQDDASGPACAPAAGALADGGAPAGAPAPGRPYTADEEGESPWQRFAHLDGEGYWWWCSRSGESFIE
ncbi:unnamed protein product, partial [Prorocentrum cordatum]